MKLALKTAFAIMLFLAGIAPVSFAYAEGADTDTVSVIFTHDMHSHMSVDKAEKDGEIVEVGGFAKLKAAMARVQETYPDSFVLDAGDFSMGTPYQTIFAREASELHMMASLGFDATTFGNHEFDYRALGLASMLEAAEDVDLPLLIANIDWEKTLEDVALEEDAKALRDACDTYGVKPYTVIERGGVRAAVFGLIGENAVDYAPESGLLFQDAKTAAADTVAQIKDEENVDLIICLSHCGTIENETDVMEETEDYLLAEAVPDIDLIISGHSHTALDEAVQAGDTYIVSCGSYNAYKGHAVMKKKAGGRYELSSYELIPLDETIEGDAAVDAELAQYKQLADVHYFRGYGYAAEQVIAFNDIDFTPVNRLGLTQGEEPLGSLIADSYRYALEQAGEEADVTIVPLGVIRGSLLKGGVTVSDAFNISSLGYGKDGSSGYPLVKAYLTGKELKTIAEVDASISDFMGVARLYCSGLEYAWNPHRLLLNRAVDVKCGNGSDAMPVEDDKLYSVAADLYSCQMLGAVKDKSFGLLSIEPKDADGNPIADYEDHIVYAGGKELKAWYALASYIDSFEGDAIPAYYAKPQGRKVEIDSWNPAELLKQPNKIFWLAAGAVCALGLAAAGVAVVVRKRRVRKRRSQK